jgi:hypothetical protein
MGRVVPEGDLAVDVEPSPHRPPASEVEGDDRMATGVDPAEGPAS